MHMYVPNGPEALWLWTNEQNIRKLWFVKSEVLLDIDVRSDLRSSSQAYVYATKHQAAGGEKNDNWQTFLPPCVVKPSLAGTVADARHCESLMKPFRVFFNKGKCISYRSLPINKETHMWLSTRQILASTHEISCMAERSIPSEQKHCQHANPRCRRRTEPPPEDKMRSKLKVFWAKVCKDVQGRLRPLGCRHHLILKYH